ncbi:hypothetical protein [Mucilaginibacter gynuensis]|uniref:hypothetical protein n=1 Tax=Mucilaginibacter gynuensis TaxID=1302236 RepID=UPI0031F1AD6A
MRNKELMLRVLFATLAIVAIIWELTAFIIGHQAAETPKQLLSAIFLCWVVFCLFRKPQDDDDWAY